MAISIQIPAGIHQHVGTGAECSTRVFRCGAQGAEALDHGPKAAELTHWKIVRKRVERSLCSASVPKRSECATDIGASNSAAVVAHVKHRPALQALEPFCAKTQVAPVREFDESKNGLDEGW